VGDALAEAEDPGLKFLFIQEALCITVDKPRQPLPQLAQLLLKHGEGWPLRMRVRVESAPVFLGHPFGMRQ
jgi:hypothetical protein